MKKITHFMMAAALTLATAGFVACGDKDNENSEGNTTYEESATFAIYYQGQKIAAGDTIQMVPTDAQVRNDFAQADIDVENKTANALQACISMTKVEGPSAQNEVEICFSGACRTFTCPFTSDPFTMEPGQASANRITYDYTPSAITEHTLYRLSVGEGSDMANAQVIFIEHAK